MKEKWGTAVIMIFYIVGTAGHLIHSFRPVMIFLTPFMLFFGGIAVLYISLDKQELSYGWFRLLITLILTFIIEVLGVTTGMIFGEYHYGKVLGMQIFSVPVIISFNWLMVLLGAIKLSKSIGEILGLEINRKKHLIIFYSLPPIFAVIFDLLLEPVAIGLGYWEWTGGTPPIGNYAAWFIIALLLTLILDKLKLKNNMTANYLIIQIIFFTILNIGL